MEQERTGAAPALQDIRRSAERCLCASLHSRSVGSGGTTVGREGNEKVGMSSAAVVYVSRGRGLGSVCASWANDGCHCSETAKRGHRWRPLPSLAIMVTGTLGCVSPVLATIITLGRALTKREMFG
jgi:hypothetical protein